MYYQKTFLAILALLYISPLQAQDVDALLLEGKRILETGVNTAELDQIRIARTMFERATADDQRAALSHYYVALADYRLAIMLREDDEKQAVAHLDAAVEHLEQAVMLDDGSAEAYALFSNVYGLKIGFRPLTSIVLGPRANRMMARAKDLEPDNPRAVLIEATSNFNTPAMWGGSKKKAIEGFQRAASLFEQEEELDPVEPSWGHEEAYAWLGMAYQDQGDYVAARRAFDRALEVKPDYGWVKYVLLPQLEAAGDSR